MPAQPWAGFFMPGNRSVMAFEGLFRWLEKNHGKHEKADEPDEVTSSGGVTLPPISGGVPDGE